MSGFFQPCIPHYKTITFPPAVQIDIQMVEECSHFWQDSHHFCTDEIEISLYEHNLPVQNQ